MKSGISSDRVAALIFLTFVLVYGLGGAHLTAALQGDVIGPAFFPRILTVAGIVLGVLLFIGGGEQPGGKAPRTWRDHSTALVPAGILFTYALAFDKAGFLLATVPFLTIMFRYLGYPRWPGAIGYSLLITAIMFGLFHFVLDTRLPHGLLSPALLSQLIQESAWAK